MKPTYLIIHHSASPIHQSFVAINAYHTRKWNFISKLGFGCGYHYVITSDGELHQAREDNEAGAHAIGRNFDSIGICVVGWFDKGHDKLPTQKQQDSLGELLSKKMAEYSIPRDKVLFHRDMEGVSKSCPGYNITHDLINNLLDMYKVDSKLRNAIEDITGKDYKKMDSEKLQEKAAKDLEEFSEKAGKAYRENTQLESKNKSLDDQLSALKLTSAQEIRDHKGATIACRDELKASRLETEECIESKQAVKEPETWDELFAIIIRKIKSLIIKS